MGLARSQFATIFTTICCLAFVGAPVRAQGAKRPVDCYDIAGSYHRVNPTVLRAISYKESRGKDRAIGYNTNNTEDLGRMQINSIHLAKLAAYGIRRDQLFDGCTSVFVGAWLYAEAIREYGNTWRAVGRYHSPTYWRQMNYAADVQRIIGEWDRTAANN